MVAPKGPGHLVRREFVAGRGVPVIVATVALTNISCTHMSGKTDNEAAWRPLFDGKNKNGWEMTGPGELRLENGELITYGGMGLLWYAKEKLGNCQIRVVYKQKDAKSNAGVYVRIDDGILEKVKENHAPVRRDAAGKLTEATANLSLVTAEVTTLKGQVESLTKGADNRPLVVVSHSMGTIIAYDCLMHVDDCPKVDGLMAIGSPLGLDEVQDFFPKWSRADGFPSAKLEGRWVNIFDPLDVVSAADPYLGDDYQRDSRVVVEDVTVQNPGTWRHSISKYLQRSELRSRLTEMVGG
jgi:hypothetical protein